MAKALPQRPCAVCGELMKLGTPTRIKRHSECYLRRGSEVAAAHEAKPSIPSEIELPQDYEHAKRIWQRYIGCAERDYQGPAKAAKSTTQRLAIISDLHAPFHLPDLLADFISREKGSDICVVGGDLQDFYAVSRFTKYEHVPVKAEFAAATHILERLSEAFPRVVLIEGNHDAPRLEKQLFGNLSLDVIEAVRWLAGGELSPMAVMAKQLPNVELVKNKVDRFDVNWYTQIDDVIVSHAEKFSRVPGSTLRSVEDWMADREIDLNLKPWRVLIQAHTHQLGWFPWRADKLLVESGCGCSLHGYQLNAKLAGRPQRNGWVTLEQTNGVTDMESVSPVWWQGRQRRTA